MRAEFHHQATWTHCGDGSAEREAQRSGTILADRASASPRQQTLLSPM